MRVKILEQRITHSHHPHELQNCLVSLVQSQYHSKFPKSPKRSTDGKSFYVTTVEHGAMRQPAYSSGNCGLWNNQHPLTQQTCTLSQNPACSSLLRHQHRWTKTHTQRGGDKPANQECQLASNLSLDFIEHPFTCSWSGQAIQSDPRLREIVWTLSHYVNMSPRVCLQSIAELLAGVETGSSWHHPDQIATKHLQECTNFHRRYSI